MAAKTHPVGIDHVTVVPKPAAPTAEADVDPESVAGDDED